MPLPPHWTERYLRDRIALTIYKWTHRDAPWLTPDAVRLLDAWLRPNHLGVEWGSGRSTLWFAKRISHLLSIEHDPKWFERISEKLIRAHISNVKLVNAGVDLESHLQPVAGIDADSIDFALIDGVSAFRAACAATILPKIRPGGLLVIDDSHRYFSYETRSPLAIGADRFPLTKQWAQIAEATKAWKRILTTSGVTDTMLLFRPPFTHG